MTEDHRYTIIEGDCIKGMATLPDGCVHTCVTSPPYWGLRDYGHDDQIGAEKTPEAYVENMVNVFREVKRVLRDDGTVWLNLGDSYWSNTLSRKDPVESMWGKRPASDLSDGRDNIPTVNKRGGLGAAPIGIKPKDLVGIPWRVALALQADGWYLRQDIIWHKPNPMPEAVADRCTKAHEYIFLLSKSQKYYYDHNAIKEPVSSVNPISSKEYRQSIGRKSGINEVARWDETDARSMPIGNPSDGKRNKRSVWTVTTKPFRGAHFATFPKDLIEPCVLAGTSQRGCCSKCGAPWERQIESTRIARNELPPEDPRYRPNTYKGAYGEINGKGDAGYNSTKTLGWSASCKCKDAEIVPCTVFDPFTGSGTTCVVALNHNRRFIGTELNPDYIKIATERISDEAPMSLMDVME